MAAPEYALEDAEVWWDRLSRLGHLEAQVAAVQALAARDQLTGIDIANALDIEYL